MNFYTLLKKVLKKILPESVLNFIKVNHYQNVLKNFEMNGEPDLKIVEKIVKKGEFVVDIGANIGIYTKFLSKFVGENGKVISIEPIPTTFHFLKNNVEKLRLKNVELFNYAISEKETMLNMVIPKVTAGANYFRAKITSDKNALLNNKKYVVKSTLLDNLLKKIDLPISFIKCDVEGHELSFINGSFETIEKYEPAFLIEVDGDPSNPGSDGAILFSIMQNY